jgi:hypothetical protein
MLLLLYASGQIKVSCYPFFDTAPVTITHRQGRIKKRILPNTRVTGGGAATILSQLRGKRKKSPVSLADIEAILEIIEKS